MPQRPKSGWLAGQRCLLLGLLILALQPGSRSVQAHEKLAPGSSSRKHRVEAARAIPFERLNQKTQRQLRDVVNSPSFYRRLPVASIDADPDYFRFLIRKPEVIVSIWQLMGVTQMTTERTGPYQVKTNDGAGTMSNLELIYGDNDLHVFYGTGSYEGSFLRKKLTGRCVIVIRTKAAVQNQGGFDLTSQLDVFLRVDNATASLIAKTIQPVVGSTADHNFLESMKFVERLNQTTRNNGPGVKAMGQRLTLDSQTRQSFNRVVDGVFARAYRSDLDPNVAIAGRTQGELELYRPASRQYNYFGLGNQSGGTPDRSLVPETRQRLSKPIVRPQSPGGLRIPSLAPHSSLQTPLDRPWPDQANHSGSADFGSPTHLALRNPAAESREGISILEGGPRQTQRTARAAPSPTRIRLSDTELRR